METPQPPKMTKRQALLALLAATPVLAYGQEFKPGGLRLELDGKRYDRFSLLELNLTLPEPHNSKALFLRVVVNQKEELTISVDEALEILKGPASTAGWGIKEN
jgi:hypothetical protein